MLTRRQFTGGLALFAAGSAWGARSTGVALEHRGVLIGECTLAGETRADDVVPAHPSGLQLSRDRWLIVYATRGFRGVDDDLSIVYQVRRDAPDGTVLKEGFLARTRDDWDPFNEGKKFVRQHGHPVAFGVPKGARIQGKPALHANVFVAKWRVCARAVDPQKRFLIHSDTDPDIGRRTQGVEWTQFRLNDREDDLEVLVPATLQRQKGHESGDVFTSAEKPGWMNQSFTPPVPLNRDASEWGEVNAFEGGRLAALRYAFDVPSGRYQWVQTGPYLADPARGIFEASLARTKNGWIVSARLEGQSGVAWTRTDDPFTRMPAPTIVKEPTTNSPLTLFSSADGVLRLFTGENGRRDPLYMWDVDPDADFAVSNKRLVFDSVGAKLPIRSASQAKIDMAKLLPAHGRTHLIVHRVSVRSFNHPYANRPAIPIINADEKKACGISYARLTLDDPGAPPWDL